jgi:hypothetical protein
MRLTALREAKVETYRIPLAAGTPPVFNSPTPKPTNTPESPLPPYTFCHWDEMRLQAPWKNAKDYGIFAIERHGWDLDGYPIVSHVVLEKLEVWQDGTEDPEMFLESLTLGNHSNPISVPINRGPDERLYWGNKWYIGKDELGDIRMPAECSPYNPSSCDFFRRMILQVHARNSFIEDRYAIHSWFYFPEYNETCFFKFSVHYGATPEPVETEPTTEDPGETEEPTDPPPTDPPTDPPEPTETKYIPPPSD